MFDAGASDTLWLSMTNLSLGLMALACLLIVLLTAILEFVTMMEKRTGWHPGGGHPAGWRHVNWHRVGWHHGHWAK